MEPSGTAALTSLGPALWPTPLMQPTNAGDAGRHRRPGLPVGLWIIGL
jgi:hypothetical protein